MKKEEYYTKENAAQKNSEWKSACDLAKKHKPFQFAPKSSALLVLDMQEFFLLEDSHAFVPSALNIIPNIQKLIQKFTISSLPIVFTQHITDSSDRDLMHRWWRDTTGAEDKKSRIISDFDTNLGQIIRKHQYSAFYGTNLDEVLQKMGVTQLVITGVLTHLCCESTARDAFMHGYEVFFPFDANASYNESLHLGAVRAITHGFGICLPTTSLL